eukprot:TRINITY_DN4295_c0_g1_i1.p1 TRINITY_DN4295_c0_g1~~TRINITY_DN4295_c0_g1_i1.p1  ORF type:complete len:371 (-),score=113.79 TRINITY_DN4295_c0_g1_i1:71-1018(-)
MDELTIMFMSNYFEILFELISTTQFNDGHHHEAHRIICALTALWRKILKQNALTGESFIKVVEGAIEKHMLVPDELAVVAHRFLKAVSDSAILCHGFSRSMKNVVLKLAENLANLNIIIVTDEESKEPRVLDLERELEENPEKYNAVRSITLVPFRSVAFALQAYRVHIVLVGAHLVTQSGGIIADAGTYDLSILAAANSIPFYVTCETFKFIKDFPLQQDSSISLKIGTKTMSSPICNLSKRLLVNGKESRRVSREEWKREYHIEKPSVGMDIPNFNCNILHDFTPSKNVTLIITEDNILCPSAVSEKINQLNR